MFNKTTFVGLSLVAVAVIGGFVFLAGLERKSRDSITSDAETTGHMEMAGQNRSLDFNAQNQKNIRRDFPVFDRENVSGGQQNVQDGFAEQKEVQPEDGVTRGDVYSKDELLQTFHAQKYESSQMSDGSEEFDLLLARQEAYYLENTGSDNFNKVPATDDNVEASSQDEFAEQIDQALILKEAIAAGYYFDKSSQASDGPRDDNAMDLAKGDYYYEINQQDVFANARIEGIELPEVAPNAPVESNVSNVQKGE